jgi:hypothetical protein
MHNELDSIKKYLTANEYSFIEKDNRIIVQDPYCIEGPEGLLVINGYNNVTLRTYSEVCRFISDRT